MTDHWLLITVHKYGLLVMLITFTLLSLLYDVTVPLFEKPDELKHFALIQFIQTQHRLPIVEAGVYEPWDQEGTQPPLYHILAALATSWLDLSNFEEPPRNPHYADDRSFVWRERGNNNLYLHAPGESWHLEPVFIAARLSRWLSLLAGLATISLTYYLARLIFTDAALPRNRKPKNPQFTNLQPRHKHTSTGQTSPISQSPREASNPQPLNPSPQSPTFQPSNLIPLLAALVAFIPQFLHVSSAITNDSMSVTLAAAALVILVSILKNGGSTRYAIYLGLVLGLGAITKLSLLYLVPLAGLVLLIDLRRHRSFARFFKYGLIIAGLMLLLSGWWYWRNWQIYGDPTALNAHLLYRGGALDPRPSLTQIWQTEIVGLELSFWAAFGAGQVLLEPWLYEALRWVKYVVFVGVVVGLWGVISNRLSVISYQWSVISNRWSIVHRQSSTTKMSAADHGSRITDHAIHPFQLQALTLLILWTFIIFIALLRWMQITPASWGRLLYPTLPALGVLAAWSLSQIGLLVSRITPHGSRLASLILPLTLLTGLFLLSLVSPLRTIRAAYAKTPLIAETEVPFAEIERLDFVYDDTLRLIGYKIEQASVQPGEWLPVTLYWQATRPIDKNYSAFVHLLDADGHSIAQANTYPDGGKWPTSMLAPGEVLKDTYHVFVPPETETVAPLVTRLAMGIFEFDDPERAAKVAVDTAGQVVEPMVAGVPLIPHQWPELDPAQPFEVIFAGQIRLIGYDWVNDNVAPGQELPLNFYWETLSPPGQNLNLFIHLIDPATETQVAGFDGPPHYPTAFWQSGQTIIDSRQLTFPDDLPPGDYELRIGWYDLETFTRLETPAGDSLSLFTVSITP